VSETRTFIDWLDQRSTTWMRAQYTGAWFGIMLALPANEAVEAWILCSRMHLLDDPQSPDDVLPFIAQDRKLPRYPQETAAQHRARLIDAWNIYALGGSEAVIESQIRAAGYGPDEAHRITTWGAPGFTWGQAGLRWGDMGAFVQFRPDESGPRGEAPPYRTQFWLVFSFGFHPVTGGSKPWGTWTWGDTWPTTPGVWALTGLTTDFYRTVVGIALKWKSSMYVFRGFTFRTGSITVWGEAGHTWGEAGATWGGGFELPVPLSAAIS
jgi:hypothetical protein